MMKKKSNLPAVLGRASDAVQGDTRAVVVRAGGEMKRLGSFDAARIDREDDVVRVRDVDYVTRSGTFPAQEVYFVRDAKPGTKGPWLGEADKIAWRDPESGYDCIVLRHEDGTLGGYVGVSGEHPLWGFRAAAIPSGLGIEVHGGIGYARICARPIDERARARLKEEARRICHVPWRGDPAQPVGGDDRHAWWFGFRCDLVHDVIPALQGQNRRRALEAEVGAVYRDDAYVIAETRALALQLRAIADGEAVQPRADPPPAAALASRGGS